MMTSRSSARRDWLETLLLLATGACIGFTLAVAVLGPTSALAEESTLVWVAPGTLTIVDGDTVKIGRQRLRLLAIDAPEVTHPRCSAERKAGEAAKLRMIALLDGQTVAIRYSGRIDPYGRPLVDIGTAAAGDVGTILVGEGYALPYVGGRIARDRRAAHWCRGR